MEGQSFSIWKETFDFDANIGFIRHNQMEYTLANKEIRNGTSIQAVSMQYFDFFLPWIAQYVDLSDYIFLGVYSVHVFPSKNAFLKDAYLF